MLLSKREEVMSPEPMSPQAPAPDTRRHAPRAGWRQWLQLAVAAVLLLLLSQALWLWQTWPVRELLQQAPVRTTGQR